MNTPHGNSADSKRRLVLLGRDGVINHRIAKGFVTRWQDFAFLPGVLDALHTLRENGYTVVVVSNQSCVGRGILNWQELQLITRRMRLEVALAGGAIEKVYYCTHAPGDWCECRMPQPGLLRQAMEEHQVGLGQVYAIGNSASEVEAAMRAGCQSLLIDRGALLQKNAAGHFPQVVSNLGEAVEIMLRRATPSLDETLLREWPRLPSVAQPAAPSSKRAARIMA